LKPWFRKPAAVIVNRLEKFCSRFFSALVPATPQIAALFHRVNRTVVVVQNFPLLDEFTSTEDGPWGDRALSVAYVGSMTEVRGIKEMVAAVGLLPNSLPATLELAGDIRPPALRSLLTAFPGWNRVRELGVLNRRSVAQLLGRTQAGPVVLHD